MEVKDLNNVTSIQNLFSKAVAGAMSGQALGEGFANLINQTAEIVTSKNVELKPVESSPKETDAVKPDFKDNKVEAKKNKESKKKKQVKDTVDDKVVTHENVAQQKSEIKDPDKTEMSDSAKVWAESDVTTTENNVESNIAAETLSADINDTLNPLLEPIAEKIDILGADNLFTEEVPFVLANDNIIIASSLEVDMTNLAKLPEIDVLDVLTGETTKLSGEDLVAKIKTASNNGQLFALDNAAENQNIELVPMMIDDSREEILTLKNDKTNFFSLPENQNVDAVLLEQAKILDEKLPLEQKLKVEVSVEKEKFSYSDGGELIANRIILEEAVASSEVDALDAKDAKLASTNSFGKTSVLQNNERQNLNLQNQNLGGVAVSTTNNVVINNENVHSAGIDNISAVSGKNSNIMTGATLASEMKVENHNRSFEANNRDVYKGMSKEVIDQVKVNITKSAIKGVDKIDIRLKPEDLGNIEVKMQVSKDGKLQAHIIASRPETVEILRNEIQDLEKAFNEAGFDTDSESFTFSFQNGHNDEDQNAQLRSFIGNALEQEQENVRAENDNAQGWVSTQGLNIKV